MITEINDIFTEINDLLMRKISVARAFSHLLPLTSHLFISLLLLSSCGLRKQTATGDNAVSAQPVGPAFCADSAYAFCEAQCDFGPRTMNSQAHDDCGAWIMEKFKSYGMSVTPQQTLLKGYDGTMLRATNIIASYRPELTDRILICAHWDSRPWADNDPDEANHRKPVLAANDGASGVAVMLELARLLSLRFTVDSLQMITSAAESSAADQPTDISSVNRKPSTVNNNLGVDFICFDAEDWGTPQWDDTPSDGDTWALGAQYWAANPHVDGYTARYGILLDMVGGQGAQFYQEQQSLQYARSIVDKVWRASQVVGFGSFFPSREGVGITDDHLPVNRVAKIPCIDIIPYYPDCPQSSFGPTWHTVNDDMAHIDRNTLQAVGQTLIQVLWSE